MTNEKAREMLGYFHRQLYSQAIDVGYALIREGYDHPQVRHILGICLFNGFSSPNCLTHILLSLDQDNPKHEYIANAQAIFSGMLTVASKKGQEDRKRYVIELFRAIVLCPGRVVGYLSGVWVSFLARELIFVGECAAARTLLHHLLRCCGPDESAPLVVFLVLMDYAMTDESSVRPVAKRALHLLRRSPSDAQAGTVLLHYFYHKGRDDFVARLFARLRRNTEHLEGYNFWVCFDTRRKFFETSVLGCDIPLPEIKVCRPRSSAGDMAIMVFCDAVYWDKFVRYSVRRFKTRTDTQGSLLHVHVYDPTPAIAAELEALHVESDLFGYSQGGRTDSTDLNSLKLHYSTFRFHLVPMLIAEYARPILVLDADFMLTGDISPLSERFRGLSEDIVFNHAGKIGPYREFVANATYVRPSALAICYWTLVSRYIAYFIQRRSAQWTLDQTAMYAVLNYMERSEFGLRWTSLQALDMSLSGYLTHVGGEADAESINRAIAPDLCGVREWPAMRIKA